RVLIATISRHVFAVAVGDTGDDEVRAGARAEVPPVVARAFQPLHVRARKARLPDVDELELRRLVELLAEIAVELRLHVDLRRAVALLLAFRRDDERRDGDALVAGDLQLRLHRQLQLHFHDSGECGDGDGEQRENRCEAFHGKSPGGGGAVTAVSVGADGISGSGVRVSTGCVGGAPGSGLRFGCGAAVVVSAGVPGARGPFFARVVNSTRRL